MVAGKKCVEALRKAKLRIEIHDDHFEQNTADEIWIAGCAKNEWVVITEDFWGKGRKEAPQIRAVSSCKVRVFQLATSKIPSDQWAPTILKALPKIIKVLKNNPGPLMAKITRSGDVKILEGYFESGKEKKAPETAA